MKRNIWCYFLIIVFLLTGCSITEEPTCEHEFEIHSVEATTCLKEGKQVELCIKCAERKETILEKVEHIYEEFEISATCSVEGKIINVCKYCKDEKIVSLISTLPHELTEYEVKATCEHEGKTYEKCANCDYEKVLSTSLALPHETNEVTIEPTCLEEGYTIRSCKNCSFEEKVDIKDALNHKYSSWTTIINPTDFQDGLRTRFCSRCSLVEEEIILSSSYIDLSIIREDFDSLITYNVDSYEKLLLIFQCAIFNRTTNLNCNINFTFDSLQLLVNSLMNDKTVISSFELHVEFVNSSLSFIFTYNDEPTFSTSKTYYTQYASLNYQNKEQVRADDYDDFAVNNSVYSYNVETSDQLFYVLERGVRPICKKDSIAEKLYQEMKNILINIISDDMSEFEKVKTIHDYIIMNTIYDNELLLKTMYGETNLNSYKGFYLEGVLLDKKAVCEGISKTFTTLCNIEGIPCVTVEGYQTKNPNGVGHAWNKVYLNNSWYIVDATSDGTIMNESFEVLTYKYFLVDEEIYKQEYTGTMFEDLVCSSSINVYEKMKFMFNETVYDFNIESQEELDIIIAYFEKENINNLTIEFNLAFDYGESCLDEINQAYQNINISASFYYMHNGNSFMLIKV